MENNIIIYHGSKNRIEKPVYGYGKQYNDYGKGFYCTENIEMAKEWSVGSGCPITKWIFASFVMRYLKCT